MQRFLFVEVNFSTSKQIYLSIEKDHKNNEFVEKKNVLKCALDDLFTCFKWWRHTGKTNDDDDQLT